MAKYTQLYIDYVNDGGAIPSAFSEITDFESLFLQRYCDKEIGFETPALFALKLESKANEVIPTYKKRLYLLAIAENEANAPKKYYKYGKQLTTTADLPTTGDIDTVTPSLLGETAEHTNEEYGSTEDEAMRKLDFYNKKVKSLISTCLDEFEDLFMKVY